MKRIVFLLSLVLLLLSVTACGNSSAGTTATPGTNGTGETSGAAEDITAEIVKSGTVEDATLTQGDFSIELLSWDAGYSGHSLTKGAEVLCMRFHVKNGTDEQVQISDFFIPRFFLDGVEVTSFGSDFYGNGDSFAVFTDSELRAGAETDIFLCLDCSVTDAHTVEVDLMEPVETLTGTISASENVLTTFSFSM